MGFGWNGNGIWFHCFFLVCFSKLISFASSITIHVQLSEQREFECAFNYSEKLEIQIECIHKKHMQECYHLELAYEQEKIYSYLSYHEICFLKYHQQQLNLGQGKQHVTHDVHNFQGRLAERPQKIYQNYIYHQVIKSMALVLSVSIENKISLIVMQIQICPKVCWVNPNHDAYTLKKC